MKHQLNRLDQHPILCVGILRCIYTIPDVLDPLLDPVSVFGVADLCILFCSLASYLYILLHGNLSIVYFLFRITSFAFLPFTFFPLRVSNILSLKTKLFLTD